MFIYPFVGCIFVETKTLKTENYDNSNRIN